VYFYLGICTACLVLVVGKSTVAFGNEEERLQTPGFHTDKCDELHKLSLRGQITYPDGVTLCRGFRGGPLTTEDGVAPDPRLLCRPESPPPEPVLKYSFVRCWAMCLPSPGKLALCCVYCIEDGPPGYIVL
jgi:hypothetical protein